MVIEAGFREDERAVAAQLYWQAFGAKLGKVLGPSSRAIPFLTAVMDPDYAIVAHDAECQLLGMAGFKTPEGGLINGGLRDMARHYGWFGTAWRAVLLIALERDPEAGVFQMEVFLSLRRRVAKEWAGNCWMRSPRARRNWRCGWCGWM